MPRRKTTDSKSKGRAESPVPDNEEGENESANEEGEMQPEYTQASGKSASVSERATMARKSGESDEDSEEESGAASEADCCGDGANDKMETAGVRTEAVRSVEPSKEVKAPPAPGEVETEMVEKLETPSTAFMNAWKSRSCAVFTGEMRNADKNCRFLAVNHTTIPCQAQSFRGEKPTPFRLTIVTPLQAGFSKTPYKIPFEGGKAIVPKDAKNMFEMRDDRSSMTMWPFEKAGAPGNRGPIIDSLSFTVEPGDTFIFFLSAMDFGCGRPQGRQGGDNAPKSKADGMLPDVAEIAPNSLLEVMMTSKNGETASKGSAVRIVSIRLSSSYTLYSFFDSLRRFPGDLPSSHERAMLRTDMFPSIAKDIEKNETSFFTVVSAASVVCDDLRDQGYISLANWSLTKAEGMRVDIALETMLMYMNARYMQFATTLLQLAINMGAVSVLVFHSDYFGREAGLSRLRGVPLIDTAELLKHVSWGEGVTPPQEADTPACNGKRERSKSRYVDVQGNIDLGSGKLGTQFRFDTGCSYEDEEGERFSILMRTIWRHDGFHEIETGSEVPCNDLIVCQPLFNTRKCVEIGFDLMDVDGKIKPVLNMVMRADQASSQCFGNSSYKRARIGGSDALV